MISFSGLILYLNHGEDGGSHIKNMSLLLMVNWEHLQCFSCMVQSFDLICKIGKPGLCHGGGDGLHIKNMSTLLMVNLEH